MNTIEISEFSSEHQQRVVAVILPIQQQEFALPISLAQQPDLLDIAGFYQTGNGNFWVALSGEEVVGTIALLDIGDDRGALRKMFVKKAYRGASHGVAQQLLAALFSWCEAREVGEVFLGTTAKFLAAHRFYEKHGFVELQKHELPTTFPVMVVDTKFYRRATRA